MEAIQSTQSPSPTAPFRLIAAPHELVPLLATVRDHAEIALDTEADSLHHYYEKLCRVQLSIGGEHWVIDPLAEGLDLSDLLRLLEERLLILHGADDDLRMWRRAWGFRPPRLFDTMLAA